MFIIGFAVTVSGAMCAWADPVTPEQAGQVAWRFMTSKRAQATEAVQGQPVKAPVTGEWETKAVFGATDKKGAPYLYAVRFAQEGGYVIVSGDDRFAPVLGYSESGVLNEAQMPDNMRAWLEDYIAEMRYWDSVDYQPSAVSDQKAAISDQKAAIKPMITTMWNQGSPFNGECPLDNNDKRSVTGCVATAMAQLIHYYRQHYNAPMSVVAAIPAYTTKSHGLSVASVAAGTSLPDMSLLQDSYDNTATEAQETAVAQLMLYCGASVKMDYTSGSSSANSGNVPDALISYFGFDGTTRYENRSAYTYAAWQDIIYNELATSHPVYYRGGSSGGGHAFIVDGYDGNGLFHINWGWGGSSNDYFALSVLNPDDNTQIGASSSSDGYTIDQGALLGVQINTGETLDEPVRLTVSNLRVDEQDVVFAAYNHTGETYSFNAGIGFIDAAGNITKITSSTYNDLQDNYGYSSLSKTVPTNKSLANQTKKIVPISRKASLIGKWYTGANPDIYYYTAVYDANGVPTLTAHPATMLTVDTMYVTTSHYVNEKQSVMVEVTNSGDEFYGKVYLFATLVDTVADADAQIGLTALESTTQTVAFEWTPVETGTYRLILALDKKGQTVLGESKVTIKEDASLKGKTLAIMAYTFENEDRSTFRVDDATGIRSKDVYGSQLTGKVRVKNVSENNLSLYKVRVFVEKYDASTGSYIPGSWNSYFTLTLAPGNSINLNMDRTVETDNTYRICLVLHNSPTTYLDDRYVVHMRSSKPEPTAVESIQPSAISNQKIIRDGQLIILRNGKQYTLQGQLIR